MTYITMVTWVEFIHLAERGWCHAYIQDNPNSARVVRCAARIRTNIECVFVQSYDANITGDTAQAKTLCSRNANGLLRCFVSNERTVLCVVVGGVHCIVDGEQTSWSWSTWLGVFFPEQYWRPPNLERFSKRPENRSLFYVWCLDWTSLNIVHVTTAFGVFALYW